MRPQRPEPDTCGESSPVARGPTQACRGGCPRPRAPTWAGPAALGGPAPRPSPRLRVPSTHQRQEAAAGLGRPPWCGSGCCRSRARAPFLPPRAGPPPRRSAACRRGGATALPAAELPDPAQVRRAPESDLGAPPPPTPPPTRLGAADARGPRSECQPGSGVGGRGSGECGLEELIRSPCPPSRRPGHHSGPALGSGGSPCSARRSHLRPVQKPLALQSRFNFETLT